MDDIDDIEERLAPYEVTGLAERPADFADVDSIDPFAVFAEEEPGSIDLDADAPLAEVIDFVKFKAERQPSE